MGIMIGPFDILEFCFAIVNWGLTTGQITELQARDIFRQALKNSGWTPQQIDEYINNIFNRGQQQ